MLVIEKRGEFLLQRQMKLSVINKARSIKPAKPVSPALPVLPLMEITSPAGDYGNVNKRCGVCRGKGGG